MIQELRTLLKDQVETFKKRNNANIQHMSKMKHLLAPGQLLLVVATEALDEMDNSFDAIVKQDFDSAKQAHLIAV